MHIAFMEAIPVLERELKRRLRETEWESRIISEAAREGVSFDLAVCDRPRFPERFLPKAELYLISGETKLERSPWEGVLLTGGMSRWDAVTLTSIGEDRAMLCLQREITLRGKSIVPFEKPIPYDRHLRLYKNLALGFCLCLAEQFLGEES